jgi:hypothetical protein
VAKVTILMPAWKEEKLAPASFAIPLDHGDQGIQMAKRWAEKQP